MSDPTPDKKPRIKYNVRSPLYYLHKKLLARAARAMNHIRKYADSPRDPNFKKDYEAAWWEAEYCLSEIEKTLNISKRSLYHPEEAHD